MSNEPSDAEKIRDALTGTNWRDLATAPWVKVEHLLLSHIVECEDIAGVLTRAAAALPILGRNKHDGGTPR